MYNVLLILQIGAVIISLVCVAILGYERTRIQQKLLMITIICAYIYSLGYAVELLSTTYSQAFAALKIEYTGVSFLVTCYIAFLVKYFKKQHNRFIFGYFFFIDVMTLIAVLRMEVCDWYYISVGFSYEGLFPHLVIERGPLYYIFFANNVVLVCYGFILVLQELNRQKNTENSPMKKRTLILLFITTLIPFIPYLFGSVGGLKYFDFVALGFLISAIILLIIVVRDNIFDVVTGAHEQMFASMHDAVIIVNSQMEFLEANKAAVQIFPSLFNYQIEKRCPDEVVRIFQDLDQQKTIEIKGRYYERHSSKVYKENSFIGSSVLLIDMTDSNELMNQLREMKNQADQANKAKSTFLANVSHELRTPLNAVIGYSDLIIQETESSMEEDYAYAIRKAADNLLSIINTILDISKIESGKTDIIRAEYSTIDLFSEVVNIISIPAHNKGLELVVDIDPQIPTSLYGDKGHIRQVLINLLNNAIKFTEKGQVKLIVQGNQGEAGFIELEFRVIDTGIGIKEDDLQKIFERFEQTNNDKIGSIEGTGLGLYISKSLIGLMGGSLTVESEYGKGSKFTVKLVQRVCSVSTISEMPSLVHDNEKVKKKLGLYAPKAKVLSVDDNHVNNGVLYEFCKSFGIEAVLADSGKKAIELLKQQQFDLIFLDQMMPGMDGVETLKEIRKLPNCNQEMTILAFTANAIQGNMEYLLSEGFDDVVLKPIGISELEEVLVYYLPDDVKESKKARKEKQNEIVTNDQETHKIIDEADTKQIVQEEVAASMVEGVEVIDYSIGLEHCNQDRGLYLQMMRMLLSYVPEKLAVMEQYVKEKEYKSYVIEVHALKNNAALIGAMKLSEDAKRLEFAGKEERYEEIDANSPQLIHSFRDLLQYIEKNIDRTDWL